MKKDLRKEILEISHTPLLDHDGFVTEIVNLIKREKHEVSKELFEGFGNFVQAVNNDIDKARTIGDEFFKSPFSHRHAANKVLEELNRANGIHGMFTSLHHGIAVIREEYLELEKEIFLKEADIEKVQEEALQLSAMGMKMWLKAEELKK